MSTPKKKAPAKKAAAKKAPAKKAAPAGPDALTDADLRSMAGSEEPSMPLALVPPTRQPSEEEVEAIAAERGKLTDADKAKADEREAMLEKLEEDLSNLEATVTQREWLLVCRALDATRADLAKDGSLRLLALGFVREKRDHGGASWDKLLDMTDAELLELHGVDTSGDDD